MNMKTDEGGIKDEINIVPQNAQIRINRNIQANMYCNEFQKRQISMNSDLAEEMNYEGNRDSFHRGNKRIKIKKYEREMNEDEEECDDEEMDQFACAEEELDGDGDYYRNKIQKQNKAYLRQDPGKSQEYCETHYQFSDGWSSNFQDIGVNQFWADLCQFFTGRDQKNTSEFLTKNLLVRFNSISELIFAVAFLALPFNSATHEYNQNENRSLNITLKNNSVVFTKVISETKSNIDNTLMVAQLTNEYSKPDQEDQIEEYIVNKVYSHKTILTNITSEKIEYELLIQIPQGSIPVHNSDYIKTVNESLDKFFTKSCMVSFYFPQEGDFVQAPPSVSLNGVVVATGESLSYKVVKNVKTVITTNLENILETGTKEDLLEFFSKANPIKTEEVHKVLKFTNDENFYKQLIRLLRAQCIYYPALWNIGFLHNDLEAIKDILKVSQEAKRKIGGNFHTSLLTINEANGFNVNNHLDYDPVLNSRVHRLGQNTILNKELRMTYEKFIMSMIELNDSSEKAKLRLCYYLIIQDRIEEAVSVFSRVDFKKLVVFEEFLIQYDYIAAYLDISTGFPDFKVAKEICTRYKNFPLLHWREYFEDIEDQLIQYLGQEKESDIDAIVNENRKSKLQASKVDREQPHISFKIEKTTLNINYQNIEEVKVKLYYIDIEVMFSSKPFLKSDSGDFSFVKPNFIEELKVSKTEKLQSLVYPIKGELANKNLYIEVSSGGIKKFDLFFTSTLKVSLSRNLGEVRVFEQENKPLNKVYIKSFAQMKDGSVKFYKDGYTDLRGNFNYVSLNTNQINQVQKFAILINDDKLGSVIKEISPPENLKVESGGDLNEYECYQNMKQEVKQMWRTKNKKK